MEIITGNGQTKTIKPKAASTDNSQKIQEAYAMFLADDSIVEQYASYNLLSAMVLVRVFAYIPWDNLSLKGVKGTHLEDDMVAGLMHVSPYAKVLNVGADCTLDVKAGDVLKLQDHLTMTIKNPQYEAWQNNDLSKSNAKQIGEQPPRYLQPIFNQYKSVFTKNGLDSNLTWDDKLTLLLPQSFFTCKVSTEL